MIIIVNGQENNEKPALDNSIYMKTIYIFTSG